MRILLIGGDASPSNAFRQLKPALCGLGFDVQCMLGDGKPFSKEPSEIEVAVSVADFVLLGMSSSPKLAQVEIDAGQEAVQQGKKFGFYGDCRGCWTRAKPENWFGPLASAATLYLGVNWEDAERARLVFPNAMVSGSGNPLREEMAFPRVSRNDVRRKLGIVEGEVFVLSPGDKVSAANTARWTILMEALFHSKPWMFNLVLSTHPGDRATAAVDSKTGEPLELYEKLVATSPVPARLISKEFMSTSDMMVGADLVVGLGVSTSVEAVYRRLPVVNLYTEAVHLQLMNETGSRLVETDDDGVSFSCSLGPIELSGLVSMLLTDGLPQEVQQRQNELYPLPTKQGITVKNMAEAIAKVI